jgi:hypothetical protein
MFTITEGELQTILFDYGIEGACIGFCELQRYGCLQRTEM